MASPLPSSMRHRSSVWPVSGAASLREERLDTLFCDIVVRVAASERPTSTETPARVGPWHLGAEIGRGSSAAVYAAVHVADGRAAAVKLGRPERVAAFAREAAMLRHLAGASVVGCLGAGVHDDGRPYVAMTGADGLPLTQAVRGLSGRRRLDLFLDVCAATGALHRRQVVHADLKPSHVRVAVGGRVVLLDVGSAVHLCDRPDEPTRHPLTPEFAAPEQIVGQALSRATDVYALGLLLHEILCGRARRLPWALGGGRGTVFEPLVAADLSSILQHRRSARLAGAARTGERLDWRVESVLDRALQTEPDARYATADGLARALRAAIAPPAAS